MKLSGRKGYSLGRDFRTQLELNIMIWPAIILICVFHFFPLFGIFHNFQFWPMIKNTLGINLLSSLVGLPLTLLFALLLNEITSAHRLIGEFILQLEVTHVTHSRD